MASRSRGDRIGIRYEVDLRDHFPPGDALHVMEDFEKLGKFYLGRGYDLESRTTRPELVLYDSPDMTTHAVCVGTSNVGAPRKFHLGCPNKN